MESDLSPLTVYFCHRYRYRYPLNYPYFRLKSIPTEYKGDLQ